MILKELALLAFVRTQDVFCVSFCVSFSSFSYSFFLYLQHALQVSCYFRSLVHGFVLRLPLQMLFLKYRELLVAVQRRLIFLPLF